MRRCPISNEDRERARDQVASDSGWAILSALLRSDIDIPAMARRLGRPASYIHHRLANPRRLTIRDLSDFAAALGCRMTFGLHPRDERRPNSTANNIVRPVFGGRANPNSMASVSALRWAA